MHITTQSVMVVIVIPERIVLKFFIIDHIIHERTEITKEKFASFWRNGKCGRKKIFFIKKDIFFREIGAERKERGKIGKKYEF